MSLRGKLILLTSGLGAALVALAFLLVHYLFTSHVHAAARDDIAAAGGTLKQSIARSLDTYRVQGKVVSDETLAKEALMKGAADLAYTYVDSVHDRTGAEYLVLTDGDARVVADLRKLLPLGTKLGASAGGVPTEGKARTGFVVADRMLVAAAVVPVTLRDRQLGALVLGDAVTPARLADVQRVSGSGVTMVAAGGVSPISTLPDAAAAEVVRFAGACDPARMGAVEEVAIGGTPHLIALEPLHDVAGAPIGCVVLTRSLAAQLAELAGVQRRLLLFGLAITALAIAGGWLIGARVARPIQSLTGAALRIAAGDLSLRELEQSGGDEVGQMAEAFNRMLHSLQALAELAERIGRKDLTARVEIGGTVAEAFNRMLDGQRGVVRQIGAASVHLAGAGAEIYAAAQQQESAAAHQSAGVEEVSRTMQSLLGSASHIAESAREVLTNAERTKDMTDGMSRRIADLNGHTARIAELLDVIRDIADRSDLLALNASLEATRAGEAGRAFAIVAGEMRRLAERVTGSVGDVKALLADVRSSGGATVAATDEARALAIGTTESARRITSVTQQQRTATEQVLESMQHISAILTESVASAHEARSSAGVLKHEADGLATLVGEFRVEEAGPE